MPQHEVDARNLGGENGACSQPIPGGAGVLAQRRERAADSGLVVWGLPSSRLGTSCTTETLPTMTLVMAAWRTLFSIQYSGEGLLMASSSHKRYSLRAGLAVLVLAGAVHGSAVAAHAQGTSFANPSVIDLPLPSPADPPPTSPEPAPSEPEFAPPPVVEPPAETVPPPPVVVEPAPADPPASAVVPAPARPAAPAVRAPAVVPVLPPVMAPAVVPPVEVVPVETQAAAEPSPSATPTSTKPAATAPTEAPASELVMNSQVQAAVAVATGSPLAVQVITVLFLLGLGYAYFRFIGAKKVSGAPGAGKS